MLLPCFALRRSSFIWRAGEARLRSAHIGRPLPFLLWGKSPCLWAESAIRRLGDVGYGTSNEAAGRAAVSGQCLLHQHSHVVSAHTRAPTERGSFSSCLPFGSLYSRIPIPWTRSCSLMEALRRLYQSHLASPKSLVYSQDSCTKSAKTSKSTIFSSRHIWRGSAASFHEK